jgi:mannitol operon transcriptional antiterminator
MGMDQEPMELRHLLLMLSPEGLSDEGLDVLSFISALIIENDESLTFFQSGDETLILSRLSSALDTYYKEKTRSVAQNDKSDSQ